MSLLTKILFGSSANKDVDIPALIKGGALVIDVRTVDEFSGGHIEGAINIPHNVISHEIAQHEKNKTSTIIVYCQAGIRSTAAQHSLESAGYTHIVNGGGLQQMRNILGQ